MGTKEEPMVSYYDDPAHFADLINGWIYHGEKQLTTEQIQEVDTRYTAKTNRIYRTRYRDIAKRVQNVRILLIVGTEMQTYVDYSMPVRGMDYDAVEYKRQIARIKRTGQMSSMQKNDRLIPAITLVLYLGEKVWDAADNLHEILDFSRVPEEWKEYIQNYKVHILDICHTEDERLMEFPNDIACMFLTIKYAKDKKKLTELIRNYPQFQKIEKETYDTLWNYVGNQQMLDIKNTLEEGGVDMRCAIDEIYEDGIAEGEKRGETRGIIIGEKQGITIGEERMISGTLELLKELGYAENNARFQLERKFHLSEEKITAYMRKYWNNMETAR